MKIFLTGGSSFIGKNLIEILNSKYNIFFSSHKELDLENSDKVFDYLKDNNFDLVIHAANIATTRKDTNVKDIYLRNQKMFYSLIRAKEFFKRMIVFGSGAEYDKSKEIVDIKEDDFDNFVPIDEYGFSKYSMSKYAENVDFITHLRFFGVFGKYEDYASRFISNNICRALYNLSISINQNMYFDYTYIKDIINIVDKFIENSGSGKEKFYNAASGQKVDLLSIANIIKEVTGSKKEIIIKRKGLNKEYSCNSDRLKQEFPDLVFTDIKESIIELTNYYKDNLNKINKEDLIFD